MDGSVSTLAPLFAAAFATHNTWADLSGRPGRLGRRRHLDGLCRGAVRRRLAHRPRLAGAARRRPRRDDHARRPRPHAALPDPAFLDRDRVRVVVVVVELAAISWIRMTLHGHAVPARGVPGRGRRRAGVRGRDIDRECVSSCCARVTRPLFESGPRSAPCLPAARRRSEVRTHVHPRASLRSHLGPLPMPRRRELIGKRVTGYLNWQRSAASSTTGRRSTRSPPICKAAAARPHRRHRRHRQHRAAGGISRGARLARRPRPAADVTLGARQSRRLCARGAAHRGAGMGRVHARRRRRERSRSCAGADRSH